MTHSLQCSLFYKLSIFPIILLNTYQLKSAVMRRIHRATVQGEQWGCYCRLLYGWVHLSPTCQTKALLLSQAGNNTRAPGSSCYFLRNLLIPRTHTAHTLCDGPVWGGSDPSRILPWHSFQAVSRLPRRRQRQSFSGMLIRPGFSFVRGGEPPSSRCPSSSSGYYRSAHSPRLQPPPAIMRTSSAPTPPPHTRAHTLPSSLSLSHPLSPLPPSSCRPAWFTPHPDSDDAWWPAGCLLLMLRLCPQRHIQIASSSLSSPAATFNPYSM